MKAVAQDIDIKLTYRPMPKQKEFHADNAKYRAFGGGVGNGKTSAGCVEALLLSLEYPGTHGVIARKTRPELKSTTQDVFFNGGGGDPGSGDFEGCPQELIRSWNKTDQKLVLINGSVIWFIPLDDAHKLKNMNLGWFMIDQAEEVPEEFYMMIQSRLRRRNSPRKGIILFNPEGHDWIWRRWVHLQYPEHGLTHATSYDNPNLPKDYIKSLENWPESWRNRYMMGSFEVFTGQIWPEFDEEVHTLMPLPIEKWWEWAEGIDHGRRNPTAVLWVAFVRKWGHDYAFVVEEHYEAGKVVSHHAKKIIETRRNMGVYPNYTVIDASAGQKDPNTERSVIDEYWDHGVFTIPSDRHRPARINRVAEWLRLDPECPHPVTGETREEGWPHLYIFKNCVELIEHVPQYKWKPKPPGKEEDDKEEVVKKDDHDVDALGYVLMTRPPVGFEPKKESPNDPRTAEYWNRRNGKMGKKRTHSKLGSEA